MAEQEERPSDRLLYKVIGLALTVVGHGLYLMFHYVRRGRVNPISLGLCCFLATLTLFALLAVWLMRRSEASEQENSWYRSRDDENLH